MTDHISITGVIATQPRSIVTSEGLAICSFRVASPQRHFSKSDNQWVEGETNWFDSLLSTQLPRFTKENESLFEVGSNFGSGSEKRRLV
jgi:hypothetical protein